MLHLCRQNLPRLPLSRRDALKSLASGFGYLAFAGLALLRLPLPLVIVLLVPASILAARRASPATL